jgi:serine phosphatase RsbU (regulator of sigma subunit)
MNLFDQLSKKIDALKDEGPGLLEVHRIVWESWMMMNVDQFAQIVARLLKTERVSAQAKCWDMLSDGLLNTFHPAMGNAFDKLIAAEEAFLKINGVSGAGAVQSLLVVHYKNNGQLGKAQEYVQSAIQNIGNDETYLQFLCVCYYQAGEMHHLLKDYESAIQFYATGLDRARNNLGIYTRLLVGLGSVYKDTNEPDKALEYFEIALKQLEGKNNTVLESKVYADLGNYYFRKSDFEQAVAYHQRSIAIREKYGMKNSLITNYIELAELYLKELKTEEALTNALLAEKLAVELNIVIKLYHVYRIISTIYEAKGNTPLALDYYKKYHETKEEVFSQESARKMKQLTMRHEMETVEKEKELFKLRNVVLKEALDDIEASVRYAQRIQHAILPPIDLIREKLPETFVLYKPKDIVAGDFYWMEEINNTLFIAAADCTGHGVPGAMVSVVCSNALNRAIKEFDLTETGKILDKACELVVETFVKSNEDVKDGMDISLLAINSTTKKIQWSGANNPLWYVDEGKWKEITADKKPIGKSDQLKAFTTHTLPYKTGTAFYLFTDGYADQFGGKDGKKFKYKPFQKLLATLADKKPAVQETHLSAAFENWKGDLEQVDDVCVVGIRL